MRLLYLFVAGGGPGDAEEVRAHPFFAAVNWDDLLRKNIPAPFVPRIGSPTDVSNFSEEFTNMDAIDGPGETPAGAEQVFRGYSFVAPSILFAENNVLSDELFFRRRRGDRVGPDPDKRPSTSNLVGCILQKSPFFQRYDLDLRERILGDGSFSVCRRCVDRATGIEYAVKIVSRRVDCSKEIALLRMCQGHPNIVKLVDVIQVRIISTTDGARRIEDASVTLHIAQF